MDENYLRQLEEELELNNIDDTIKELKKDLELYDDENLYLLATYVKEGFFLRDFHDGSQYDKSFFVLICEFHEDLQKKFDSQLNKDSVAFVEKVIADFYEARKSLKRDFPISEDFMGGIKSCIAEIKVLSKKDGFHQEYSRRSVDNANKFEQFLTDATLDMFIEELEKESAENKVRKEEIKQRIKSLEELKASSRQTS